MSPALVALLAVLALYVAAILALAVAGRRTDAAALARFAPDCAVLLGRLARDHPVRLMAFDLLWRDGYPRVEAPWHERRAELEGLGLDGPAWEVPGLRAGGQDLVVKRRGSRYRPGAVTEDWVVVRRRPRT